MKAAAALALPALLVLAGCSAAGAEPERLPGVVASVESAIPSGTALTVAQGSARYLIFDVELSQAGAGEACEVRSDTETARRMLVGRTIATTQYPQRWDDPAVPAGYTPARLTFVAPDRPRGDDLASEVREASARARAVACPNREVAPLSGREVGESPGSDVRVDVDRDGESRFCSRRWWC